MNKVSGGIQLYGEYRQRHRPDSVVFLHGLGLDVRCWYALASRYEDSHAMLSFDLRGHGLSARVDDEALAVTVEQMADDVASSIGLIGRTSATVIGTSVGALVALALAHRHPLLVGALGLVSVPLTDALGTEAWTEEADRVERAGHLSADDHTLGQWFSDEFRASDPATVAEFSGIFRRTEPVGYAATCRAIAAFDLDAHLFGLDVPLAIVNGADDPISPPTDGARIADRVLRGGHAALPEGRHLCVVERPDETKRVLDVLLGEP